MTGRPSLLPTPLTHPTLKAGGSEARPSNRRVGCASVLSPEAARGLRARPFASTTRWPLVARRTHFSASLGPRRRCARQSRDALWRFGAVSGGGRGGLEARLSLARSRIVAGDWGCQRRGRDSNPRRT